MGLSAKLITSCNGLIHPPERKQGQSKQRSAIDIGWEWRWGHPYGGTTVINATEMAWLGRRSSEGSLKST